MPVSLVDIAEEVLGELPCPDHYTAEVTRRVVRRIVGLAADAEAEAEKRGPRYRLRRPVERYPSFVARAGLEGTLVGVNVGEAPASVQIRLRLDEPLPGAEPWDNELHWDNNGDEEPFGTFAEDCEEITF